MTRKQRTQTERAEAVGLAEVVGTTAAARQTGIPASSIHTWRQRPEFAELREEKKEAVAADVWAAFQRGVRRVDELFPKTEDLAKVAVATGILYDKLALMRGEATSRTETKALTDDLNDTEKQRLRDWIDSIATATPPAEGAAR